MDVKEYLAIYLNDHRAGATAGTRVARRLWRSNRSTPWGARLEALADEIGADASTLDAVRQAVGVTGGELKQFGALAAERLGRFKLNGHILTYSPLSRVLETEGLMAGVQAKHRLWVTLGFVAPAMPELAAFGFAELERRGTDQLETLALFHEWAVEEMRGTAPAL